MLSVVDSRMLTGATEYDVVVRGSVAAIAGPTTTLDLHWVAATPRPSLEIDVSIADEDGEFPPSFVLARVRARPRLSRPLEHGTWPFFEQCVGRRW